MEDTQLKYYYEMFDMKAHLIYYSKCLNWCKSLDTFSQILVTIITIIGISAIQMKYSNSEMWFYISIGIQIFSLVLSLFFNYKDKIVQLELLLRELNILFLKMSDDWHKVSNGELTSNEIHKLWIDFKSKNDSLEAPSGIIGFFWYLNSAEKQANIYFNKYYVEPTKNE